MRGKNMGKPDFPIVIDLEGRVPAGHPLRSVKKHVDEVLRRMNPAIVAFYGNVGKPRVPPEQLLKSRILMALFSVRSERLFCEQLGYNLLWQWFLDRNLEESSFDPCVFTENREHLFSAEVSARFFAEVYGIFRVEGWASDEHFCADPSRIEAWASTTSFWRKGGPAKGDADRAGGDIGLEATTASRDSGDKAEIGQFRGCIDPLEAHKAGEHLQMEESLREANEAVRRSEALLRSLTDHSVDMIFVKDCESRILFMNPAGARRVGLPVEELIGRTDLEIRPDAPQIAAAFVACDRRIMASRRTETMEEEFTSLTGEKRSLLTIKTPWLDAEGNVIGIVGIGRDITERKQAEERIKQLNAELEQRVVERTAQLEVANKELESFSYSVSHDLRAPLRHVQGYVELLQCEAAGSLSDKAKCYMNTITEASTKMGTLINDLLSFSHMGRMDMQETIVDLGGLVADCIKRLRPGAGDRNIIWNVPTLPRVVGDAAMLRQVWTNLLDNALKYTRPRDPARIEVGEAGTENGRVILFVRENGVGFDPRYSQKLFGVFQRLHRAEEFEGTGIGLANVQRIIHRHGGRIWGEGKLGEGATFYFTLRRSG